MHAVVISCLALFFLDYNIFVLLNKPLMMSLPCYVILLFLSPITIDVGHWTSFFFIGLSSFMIYGNFYFIYFIIAPIILATLLAKKWFFKTAFTAYALLGLFILALNLSIPLILGLKSHGIIYTIWQLCVNIWVMLAISLIMNVAGKQDNRL